MRYTPDVERDAIRAFARRDWRLVEAAKHGYWTERLRREGPEALLRAVEGLRRTLRSVRPGWPSEEERALDLAHHIELKRRLDAARDLFTDR
jgi:hypothetical protein